VIASIYINVITRTVYPLKRQQQSIDYCDRAGTISVSQLR